MYIYLLGNLEDKLYEIGVTVFHPHQTTHTQTYYRYMDAERNIVYTYSYGWY